MSFGQDRKRPAWGLHRQLSITKIRGML